jgi:hypothetical protein
LRFLYITCRGDLYFVGSEGVESRHPSRTPAVYADEKA